MTQTVFNWVWLALFVLITGLRKWHERKAGRRSSVKGTPVVEAALMMAWGLFAGVAPFFYIFSDWLAFANYPFDMPALVSWLGVLGFLGAAYLLHRSHADLGRSWSPNVAPEAGQALVAEGVFKRTRHPMYAAHLLWGVAQMVLLPNLLVGVLPLVLMLAVVSIRVPREEEALLAEFGDRYREYMKRTGRFLPKWPRE